MYSPLHRVDALVRCPACKGQLLTNTISVPATLCPLMECKCGAQFRVVSKLHNDALCDSCVLRIDCLGVDRVKEVYRYILTDGSVIES